VSQQATVQGGFPLRVPPQTTRGIGQNSLVSCTVAIMATATTTRSLCRCCRRRELLKPMRNNNGRASSTISATDASKVVAAAASSVYDDYRIAGRRRGEGGARWRKRSGPSGHGGRRRGGVVGVGSALLSSSPSSSFTRTAALVLEIYDNNGLRRIGRGRHSLYTESASSPYYADGDCDNDGSSSSPYYYPIQPPPIRLLESMRQRTKELLSRCSEEDRSRFSSEDWLEAEQVLQFWAHSNYSNGGGTDSNSSNDRRRTDKNNNNRLLLRRGAAESALTSLELYDALLTEYAKLSAYRKVAVATATTTSCSSSCASDFLSDPKLLHSLVLQWQRAVKLLRAQEESERGSRRRQRRRSSMNDGIDEGGEFGSGGTGPAPPSSLLTTPRQLASRIEDWVRRCPSAFRRLRFRRRWRSSPTNGTLEEEDDEEEEVYYVVGGNTWSVVADVAARAGDPELAHSLVRRHMSPFGYAPSPGLVRTVLQSYARHGGQVDAARALIDEVAAFIDAASTGTDAGDVEDVDYYPEEEDDECEYDGVDDEYYEAVPLMKGRQFRRRSYGLSRPPLDIWCYNALLQAYAYHGRAEEAEDVLEDVILASGADSTARNVEPNIGTFNTVLAAWSRSNAEDAPERAQALLMRLYDPYDWGALDGIAPDATTFNTVLACWAKSKRPDACKEAYSLLQQMKRWSRDGLHGAQPDAFAYSTVLDSYAKLGQASNAEEVFQDLLDSYRNGNEACRPNLYTLTPLLQAWTKSDAPNRIEKAEQVMQLMRDLWSEGILNEGPDRAAYHVLMNGYAHFHTSMLSETEAAKRIDACFREMQEREEVRPNFHTYSIMIHFWARRAGGIGKAKALLEDALRKYESGDRTCQPDTRSLDSLVQIFARSGHLSYATELVFETAEGSAAGKYFGRTPHRASFGTILSAYRTSKDPEAPVKADRIVRRIESLHTSGILPYGPDYLMYRSLLLCRAQQKPSSRSATQALEILLEMRSKARQGALDRHPDTVDCNVALRALSRTYLPQKAERLLHEMVRDYKKGYTHCIPNLSSFHHVLWAWARVGSDDALLRVEAILEQMTKLHQSGRLDTLPDTAAYNNLLHCLSRMGSRAAAERANVILKHMIESNDDRIRPGPVSYKCVVDAWIRAGNVAQAESTLQFFHQECKNGIYTPYDLIYSAVADAWTSSKEPDARKRSGMIRSWFDELQVKAHEQRQQPRSTPQARLLPTLGRHQTDSLI